ncbi:hypothetical protein BG003_009788, partial [Podila horticola]
MKNLFSVLLITTLAVASSLAAPETPQGGAQVPITSEDGALWEKKKHHHHNETVGQCNFRCDRVAVGVCVGNAGPNNFDACSDVFSCQHRCESKFGPGAQDSCGEVCASRDCKQTCIYLRHSG